MGNPSGLCRAALAFREGRAEQGILVKLQLLTDVLALALPQQPHIAGRYFIPLELNLKGPLCILFLDMGKCPLTKGKQALEIRSSLSEKRALTDPVQQSPSSAESLARNLQWAKAHGTVQSAFS